MKYLFTISQSFRIPGKGLILPFKEIETTPSVGASVNLIRPDKSTIATTIKGVTYDGVRPDGILVLAELNEKDVPAGTEVWLAT